MVVEVEGKDLHPFHLPRQHHLSAPYLCRVPVLNATTVGDSCGKKRPEAGPPLWFGNRPCTPPSSLDLASRVAWLMRPSTA